MKYIFTLIILLLISFNVFSQNLGLYASAHIGPSFPFGDFAKKDGDNPNSGFADIGIKGDITVGYNIPYLFSVTFTVVGQKNSVNAEQLRNYIASNNQGYNWSLTTDKWFVSGLFTGVTKTFSHKKAYFEIRAFGGALNFNSPRYTFQGTSSTATGEIIISDKTTYSFCYIVAAGAGYNFSKNFSFEANVEYLGSDPEFNNVKTKTTVNGITTESSTSYSQSFRTLNLTAGIRYLF